MAELINCDFLDIEEGIRSAFAKGLTPLVVDNSADDRVSTFLSYQPDVVILEARKMIFESARRPLIQVMNEARSRLVNAMKFGKMFTIRMGDSAPDFRSTLCDDKLADEFKVDDQAFLPREIFECGGKLIRDEPWPKRLFREEDMKPHKNVYYCRDEFRVCLLTQLPLDSLDEYLFGSEWGGLPDKDLFCIVYVTHDDGAEVKNDVDKI